MSSINNQRIDDLMNDSRVDRLRRINSRKRLRRTENNNENHVVLVPSDSEEEERQINKEISSLFGEFNRIECVLSRTRQRLRRLYEKRENVRIRKAVRLRELELNRRFRNRWLPNLEEVQRNTFRVQNNILNDILGHGIDSDSDSDDLPTAEQVLNNLCGPNLNVSNLNDVD